MWGTLKALIQVIGGLAAILLAMAQNSFDEAKSNIYTYFAWADSSVLRGILNQPMADSYTTIGSLFVLIAVGLSWSYLKSYPSTGASTNYDTPIW